MKIGSERLEFVVVIRDFLLELTQLRGFTWLESRTPLRALNFDGCWTSKRSARTRWAVPMPLRLLGIISVALLLLIYSSRALVLLDGSGQDYRAVVFALRPLDLLLIFGDGSRFQAKICALIVKLENIEVAIFIKAKGYFRSISSGRQVSDK